MATFMNWVKIKTIYIRLKNVNKHEYIILIIESLCFFGETTQKNIDVKVVLKPKQMCNDPKR
jgi:hypothetical protein